MNTAAKLNVWKGTRFNRLKGTYMFRAIIVGVALIVGCASIIITGKLHNPVEKLASDIVQTETGINIDALLDNAPTASSALPSCPDVITSAAPGHDLH